MLTANRSNSMLVKEIEADGISFYLYLLCNIFKNGYYLQLDSAFFRNAFLDLEMNQEQAMSILEFFLEESLYDMGLKQVILGKTIVIPHKNQIILQKDK